MNYKAFISYKHSENGRRHAVALETALKRYAKPMFTSPMKIFRDEKHMKPGISLSKLIRNGLENSEYLIFLAEKESADSEWCGEELEYWCNPEKLNRTENLIIILIADAIVLNTTQGINFEQTVALPALLQPYLTSVPFYVDLRWAKSVTDTDLQNTKYRHEINALSAKFQGLNPEDLNDEEILIHRRNIKLRKGALFTLSFLLIISIIAMIWAFRAQKTAEISALEAKNQTLEAEKNLKRAEKINNFYFYNARFALVYGIKQEGVSIQKMFYFIDKNGDEVTKLGRWEKAEQFGSTDFARVKIRDGDKLFDYLIDTMGIPYRAALNLSDLNKKVVALDLSGELIPTFGKPFEYTSEISGKEIKDLPQNLWQYTDLEVLLLRNNHLKILPAKIKYLTNLTHLDLAYNDMRSLPKEIGDMENLREIDLSSNPDMSFNETLQKLVKSKNLAYLGLSGNNLRELPYEITKLKNLLYLDLSYNILSTLPDDIGQLQSLKEINLQGNVINETELERIQRLLPSCEIIF